MSSTGEALAKSTVDNMKVEQSFLPSKTMVKNKVPDSLSFQKCECMEGKKDIKIVDHLHKRNCQRCGAFLLNNEETWSDGAQTSLQVTLKQRDDFFFADMSPSELYSYLRLEESSHRFRAVQGRLSALSSSMSKSRKFLVDKIFEMGEKLQQSHLTIHLSVVYLDILIQDEKVFDKLKQDTLALSCLLLASKFDEVDDNIPMIREFQKVYSKMRTISYQEITQAEMTILGKLNWDLFKLTPLHILHNLIGQGVLFSNDKIISARGVLSGIDEKALKSVKKHSEFFIDLAMQEYDFNKTFKPSVIALSSVICARKVSRISPEWNSQGFEELTDYTYEGEIKSCADKLYKLYERQFRKSTPQKESPLKKQDSTKKSFHNKENQEQSRSLSSFAATSQKPFLPDKEVTMVIIDQIEQSHNTTRSDDQQNDCAVNAENLEQAKMNSLQKGSNDKQDQAHFNVQKVQCQYNESKFTSSNSTSSEPQSPSTITYCSQNEGMLPKSTAHALPIKKAIATKRSVTDINQLFLPAQTKLPTPTDRSNSRGRAINIGSAINIQQDNTKELSKVQSAHNLNKQKQQSSSRHVTQVTKNQLPKKSQAQNLLSCKMNTLHLNGNQGNSTLSTSRNSSSNYKAIKAPGQQEANNSTSALKPFAETTNTRKAVKPHFEGDQRKKPVPLSNRSSNDCTNSHSHVAEDQEDQTVNINLTQPKATLQANPVNFNASCRFSKRSVDLTHRRDAQLAVNNRNQVARRSQIKVESNQLQGTQHSKENSLTRALAVVNSNPYSGSYTTTNNMRSKIQRTNSSFLIASTESLSNKQVTHAKLNEGYERTQNRKKSIAVKNTTLEEISENQNEQKVISPNRLLQNPTPASNNAQNFIQRNINYVNKLNAQVKEKKHREIGGRTATCSTTRNGAVGNKESQATMDRQEKGQQQQKLSSVTVSAVPYSSNNINYTIDDQTPSNRGLADPCGLGLNLRRASDFHNCDYLRPTVASMSRAKSVLPPNKRQNRQEAKRLAQNAEENISFDMSTQSKSPKQVPLTHNKTQTLGKSKSNKKRVRVGVQDRSNERNLSQSRAADYQASVPQSKLKGVFSSNKRNSFVKQQQQNPRASNQQYRNALSQSFSGRSKENQAVLKNTQVKKKPAPSKSSNLLKNHGAVSSSKMMSARSISEAAIPEEEEVDDAYCSNSSEHNYHSQKSFSQHPINMSFDASNGVVDKQYTCFTKLASQFSSQINLKQD